MPATPPIVTAKPTGSAPPIASGAPCAVPGCVPMTAGEQRFAIIGDYGFSGPAEASVAALVAKVKPDFVVTTGDNHDWDAPQAQPYLDYFSLPNNPRYYETTIGAVQLFSLDSDPNEPDGTDADFRISSTTSSPASARLGARDDYDDRAGESLPG